MSSKTITDDRIAAALDALGVAGPVTREARKEAVYDALVDLWREKKGSPNAGEVRAVAGVTRSIVERVLRELIDEGRVVKLDTGVWLPVDL